MGQPGGRKELGWDLGEGRSKNNPSSAGRSELRAPLLPVPQVMALPRERSRVSVAPPSPPALPHLTDKADTREHTLQVRLQGDAVPALRGGWGPGGLGRAAGLSPGTPAPCT